MAKISAKTLKAMRKMELDISRKLFVVVTIVTVILLAAELVRFFSRGAFPASGLNFFYIGILFLYSTHKELIRWLGEKTVNRHGEYFVYVWIAVTIVLYLANFSTKGYFDNFADGTSRGILQDFTLTTLQVAAIFLFTRISKVVKILLSSK